MNCSACYGAFYRPGPLEGIFEIFISPNRVPSSEQLERLEKAIRGLRVETIHLKEEKKQPIRSIGTIFGFACPYGGPKDVEFYHEEEWKM